MNYQETIAYLYSQMPMFEKQGASGYKSGLENTLTLDRHFDSPHRQYKTIHVAGTNGKGSCSHTIAAILQTAGYKVGLYTSPHLVDFHERIRVNGQCISEDYVVRFVDEERSFFEPLHPSFFEVTTAMAFKYFRDTNVDIAVIEVGLGGRLDCTNIITPLLSVITNISFDHTQFLGKTLKQIATEKAGIIKQGIPVIIGEANSETRPVFEAKAKELSAPICFAEDDTEVCACTTTENALLQYKTIHYGLLQGELSGLYQAKNTNTVLKVVKALTGMGYLCECQDDKNRQKTNEELSYAFLHVSSLTGLRGRWQTVRTAPRVVCDTGHNAAGWEYISQQLATIKCRQLHIVFGMVDDKDINTVLGLLPQHAVYYFTKADNKRALPEAAIQTMATQYGLSGMAYPTVNEAYQAALEQATDDDFIFVGGSSYVVGDFLKNLI